MHARPSKHLYNRYKGKMVTVNCDSCRRLITFWKFESAGCCQRQRTLKLNVSIDIESHPDSFSIYAPNMYDFRRLNSSKNLLKPSSA